MAHVWHLNGATASDSSHTLYYHGQKIKEAYCRGEKIWEANPPTMKTLMTGSFRISAGSVLKAQYDTFVSRVHILTDSRVKILYEYGLSNADALTQDFRIAEASEDAQDVYHVVQTPEPYSIYVYPGRTYFTYNVYLLERSDMKINFNARFMSFPYNSGGQSGTYPGNPEDVAVWWTYTAR